MDLITFTKEVLHRKLHFLCSNSTEFTDVATNDPASLYHSSCMRCLVLALLCFDNFSINQNDSLM